MSNKKNTKSRSPKDANPKKIKKKTSILVSDKVEYIDYKDVNILTRFVSDRSKIRNRRVTGNSVQQQRRGPASDGANERAAVAETTELVDQVEGGEVETNEDEEA